jgi:hypothetical protein
VASNRDSRKVAAFARFENTDAEKVLLLPVTI